MLRIFATFALLMVMPAACVLAQETPVQETAHAPAESEGMKALFNGENLEGWDGDTTLWQVKDGVIHGQTTPENKASGNTFLIWQGGDLNDFELRLSYRCSRENNSGIQYRSKHIIEGKVSNKWVVRGYQHEIRNSNKLPDVSGFIYGEGLGRGRICLVGEKAVAKSAKERDITAQLIDQAGIEKLIKLDDWNDVVIVAKGNRIQHYLNDHLILDFTDGVDLALRSGVLALQIHAGVPMWTEFKNIRVKELN